VPGRFTRLAEDPLTIVDGAHNPAGMAALAAALPHEPVTAVVSILDDKDAAAMLRALLPHCSALVCTSSSNPRALSPATLASLAAQLGGLDEDDITLESDPREALRRARELGNTVVATGSIYLAADLLSAPGTRRASAL
jgi:dihydrofolate synthase/folylpolyglutamate synthase